MDKLKIGKPVSGYTKNDASKMGFLLQDMYQLLEAIDYANHRRLFNMPVQNSFDKYALYKQLEKYVPKDLASMVMYEDEAIVENIHHIINYLIKKYPTLIRCDTMLDVLQIALILRFEKGLML